MKPRILLVNPAIFDLSAYEQVNRLKDLQRRLNQDLDRGRGGRFLRF